MVLPVRSLAAVSTGEAVDAVVEVLVVHEGFVSGREKWFGTECRIHEHLDLGTWTLYGYKAAVVGDIVLEPCNESKKFRRPEDTATSCVSLKEVCAGIGGFSAGAVQSGFHTTVFLDRCDIAGNTVEANGGRVITADIASREAKIALHEVQPEVPCMLTAGFPCQPFSRQGDSRGFMDERAHTLTSVLEATWFVQPVGLVLECVVEAERHPLVRAMLSEITSRLAWKQHHIVLELSDRWPCRRLRWWCVLVPDSIPFRFEGWPELQQKLCIKDVIGEWPSWGQDADEQLRWDAEETSMFLDPALGADPRVLDLNGIAPTALHSWGSQLRTCPCGCRGPLSRLRLLTAGLRGFGVPLEDSRSLRHPHPQEVGLLNGLSVKFAHLQDLRAALCLIGQIASPIQSCWVFAQIRRFRETCHGLPLSASPLQVLEGFQGRLLQERRDNWHLPSMQLPRDIHIVQEGHCQQVKVTGPIQVKHVVQAERQLQGPGRSFALYEGKRPLEASALLHALPSKPYTLQGWTKRQCLEAALCDILVCVPGGAVEVQVAQGALPCQVLASTGLQAGTQLRFASTQEEIPTTDRLFGRHILDARPLVHHVCEPDELTDVCIANFLQALMPVLPEGHIVLRPSTASLLMCLHESRRLDSMSGIQLPGAQQVHVIAESAGHWYLLSWNPSGGKAVHWDPTPERTKGAAKSLLSVLCALLGCAQPELQSMHETCLGRYCCGAVALCHLLFATGLIREGSVHLVNWVQVRAQEFPAGPALHKGAGGLSAEAKQKLAELLTEKGVPEAKVMDRIAEATSMVGASKIEEGLQAGRPWAVLKAVASGVSPPFRWIRADELERHIREKADNKFGTAAGEARIKKKAQTKSGTPKEMPPLDPRQLVLVQGAFVAEDGTAVPNLCLEDVAANAHGVAVCSLSQAQPFMDESSSISVEPLAVVTTAPLSGTETSARDTRALRFPAIYGPTSEPILVSGTLVQLGDALVLPAQSSAKADQVRTGVIKVTVYQDQWASDWDAFTQAPVKGLMQCIPMLNLCKGQGCGTNCAKFHASIDESPDTVIHEVWARKFQHDNGTKAPQQQATSFQVFLRVPATAVDALQQTSAQGVYIEPRESGQSTGPSKEYSVIWLPGLDHQAALHCKRKTDRALALTRLNHKYGIRVYARDEEAAFKTLRPEHAYSRVRVAAKYRLHPLPHGLTRQGLQQLLDAWDWTAKPLQPAKGDAAGAAWEVGAECSPPSAALPTTIGFALPVQISNSVVPPPRAQVLASSRTRKHINSSPLGSGATTDDPWANGQDPWAKFRGGVSEAAKATSGAAAKIKEVHQQLKMEVNEAVQSSLAERKQFDNATESRFQQLETSLTELKAHGKKFESWFAEAGKRVDQQAIEVGALKAAMHGQQQELTQLQGQVTAQGEMVQQTVSQAVVAMRNDLNTQLSTQLNAQMEQFQALLNKKQREGRSRS